MISKDFGQWWNDLATRFPSVEAWLARCFPEQDRQRSFLRTWVDSFRDVQLQDALEVNRLMQTGELDWVGEYDADKERLPQHVRKLAQKLAYDRRDKPKDEPRELKPTSFPAGKILKRILELTDKGMPSAEAKSIVLAEMPVGRPDYQPRFNCLVCCDVGMVGIASQTALDMLLADKFHECHHRESAVRCSCRAHVPQNPKRPTVIYDPSADFKIEDVLWGPTEVERFREWVEFKRNEYWESRRHSEFDRFNQREFAR